MLKKPNTKPRKSDGDRRFKLRNRTTRNLEQDQWRNREEEWRLVSGRRRQLLKTRTDRQTTRNRMWIRRWCCSNYLFKFYGHFLQCPSWNLAHTVHLQLYVVLEVFFWALTSIALFDHIGELSVPIIDWMITNVSAPAVCLRKPSRTRSLTKNVGKNFPLLHSWNMNFSSYSWSFEGNIYEFFCFGIKTEFSTPSGMSYPIYSVNWNLSVRYFFKNSNFTSFYNPQNIFKFSVYF